MQPQVFLLGLANGSTRVHENKYEALYPQIVYNDKIYMQNYLEMGMFTSKPEKECTVLNNLQYWHTTT